MLKFTGTATVKFLKWFAFALEGLALLWTAIATAWSLPYIIEVNATLVAFAAFATFIVGYDKTTSNNSEAAAILAEVNEDLEDEVVADLLTESEIEEILETATMDVEDNQNGTTEV